jgi:putative transposase
MKQSRFTEEQILCVLKESEAGMATSEICRKYGISDATFYNWKAKYGGMEINEMRRLKSLEHENRRLKQIVADQALDIQALKYVCSKNFSSPKRNGKQ